MPSQWSEQELSLLNTVDVFLHKPGIMKKAEQQFALLNLALQKELKTRQGICPPEADTSKGQIARGENNQGFPFVSLDMPQYFSKVHYFTFRTLFWWGHYLGFSLIVKGGDIEHQVRNLLMNRQTNHDSDIWFSVSKTPWEWDTVPTCYLPLSQLPEDAIQSHCLENGFLKLLRTCRLDDDQFATLDWPLKGVETYREFTRLLGE